MSRYKTTVLVPCPNEDCGDPLHIELSVYHDRGCRYTKNGDGWPEELDVDILTDSCPHCHTPLDTEAYAERVMDAFNAGGTDKDYWGPDTLEEAP